MTHLLSSRRLDCNTLWKMLKNGHPKGAQLWYILQLGLFCKRERNMVWNSLYTAFLLQFHPELADSCQLEPSIPAMICRPVPSKRGAEDPVLKPNIPVPALNSEPPNLMSLKSCTQSLPWGSRISPTPGSQGTPLPLPLGCSLSKKWWEKLWPSMSTSLSPLLSLKILKEN